MTLTLFPVKIVNGKKKPDTNGQSWKNYQPVNGELEHADNIGVVVPHGVVVIDLDTYKGVTREQIEKHFGCQFPWQQAFVQKTLKGGEHYAFRVSAHVPQGDSLFGINGFDTRTAGKGWICTGLGYDGDAVEKLSDIGSLPWLPFEFYGDQKNELDDLEKEINNVRVDWSQEEVEKAVMQIPPIDTYGTWLEVGMALHHQSKGDKWGVILWDKWSQGCASYDREEIKSKWRSFKDGGVTFKTLIYKHELHRSRSYLVFDNNLCNQIPTPRKLIGDRFPINATSALVAMGGVGKTTWLVREAARLAGLEGVRTMFISAEDSDEDYQSKMFNVLRSDLNVKPDEVYGRVAMMNLRGCGSKLVKEEAGSFVPSGLVEELMGAVKDFKADLVVFETLSRFAGGEENERFEAVVSACDKLAQGFGGAVVLVHHTGKSQAREKVIDLYSGRGGSVLGDNTRSMTVLTRMDDDYQGSENVIFDAEDLMSGRLFEVSHVRNSYGECLSAEYYATRKGECGPVLESLAVGSEEEMRKRALERLADKEREVVDRVIDCIKSEGGRVGRKYFDSATKDKIGCSQKDSRRIIEQMIEDALLEVDQEVTRSGQTKAVLKVCDLPLTHLDPPCQN